MFESICCCFPTPCSYFVSIPALARAFSSVGVQMLGFSLLSLLFTLYVGFPLKFDIRIDKLQRYFNCYVFIIEKTLNQKNPKPQKYREEMSVPFRPGEVIPSNQIDSR